MHIPDGFLSPYSSGALFAATVPFWWKSLSRIRSTVKEQKLPLLALLAAFSFLVMMFNIPLPGGTTGHAIGGVLVAILVGPWPAVMALSVALGVQALFFGDGGIIAFGANAFNLAVIMPLAGYVVFRAAAGAAPPSSRRFAVAAAVGGYVGINIAALAVALQLGVQPLLHHLSDGTPLYCPYTISITVPAMMIPHLTVGGLAEALITGGVIAFLGKHHPELFTGSGSGVGR
jgi:cobalt/nickel transport system permease protein